MDAAREPVAIADLVTRFIAHVRRRGAESTATAYAFWLRGLVDHLAAHDVQHLHQVREEDLEEWQDALRERDLAPKSRALAATAARSWLRWLIERDLADFRLVRAVTTVRTPPGRPRPIATEDLVQVLASLAPRRSPMTLRELRDRALFFYVLASAARISEVLQVRREGWQEAEVVQKGGSTRRLRVPPTVHRVVDDYLGARDDGSPWLWVTIERGAPVRRLTRAAANQTWRRMAARLGLRRWTSHRLRDSAATWLALQGLPTHLIADYLGHHGLSAVAKYIAVAEEQRGAAQDALETLFRGAAPPEPPAPPRLRRGVKLRGRPDRRPGGMR